MIVVFVLANLENAEAALSIHGTPGTCMSDMFYPLSCGTDFQAGPCKKDQLNECVTFNDPEYRT